MNKLSQEGILEELDYSPFGMGMVGRSWEAGSGYRYGFNGKENEDEIAGNNNAIDFGARLYDSRLGRWFSCDGKLGLYNDYSPYHFGYDNPIITIDPNGEENVVVIGGKDESGANDKNKFINSGLKKVHDMHKSQPNENLTVILVLTPSMTRIELKQINKMAKLYGATNLIRVTSAAEINNYLNSKNIDNSELSAERKKDLVTDISIYGHGHGDDDNDGDGIGSGGSFEPGHNIYSVTSQDFADLSWGIDDVMDLDPAAFLSPVWEIETCNSARTNGQGKNLTASVAQQTNGTATGYDGRSDYAFIYSQSMLAKIKRSINDPIMAADNSPVPGCHNQYDDGYDSSGNCIKPSDKVTYQGSQEVKRTN